VTRVACLKEEPFYDKPEKEPKNKSIPNMPENIPRLLPAGTVPPTFSQQVSASVTRPAEPQSALPLNTSAWRPFPGEIWSGALRDVREKEFLLYCALLDVTPFVDEERGSALILDMEERYCYEVLRLDRHRLSLKNILMSFHDAREIILRRGERWTTCDTGEIPPGSASIQTSETVRKRSLGKKAVINEPYAEEFSPLPSPPARESAAAGSHPTVPFAGLVQEVTRWLNGELIMVRSEESGESGGFGRCLGTFASLFWRRARQCF
jgi:hypothetical protein